MESSRDARVAVIDHNTSKEIATEDNPQFNNQFKLQFLEVKIRILLSAGLAEDASEATILSSSVRFFNLLRESRITADRLTFSIARKVA
jgi:hypothetical protein